MKEVDDRGSQDPSRTGGAKYKFTAHFHPRLLYHAEIAVLTLSQFPYL